MLIDYMTVGEAAKELDVAADTVRWWHRIGRIPAVRTRSGIRLIDRRDVERMAEQRRSQTRDFKKGT